MPNGDFLLHVARTQTALLWRCYTLIRLEISRRTRWWCLKCVIVYLARDIPPFVMYCVYGESGSPLLIVYRLYDMQVTYVCEFAIQCTLRMRLLHVLGIAVWWLIFIGRYFR